jgi:cell wall-associated NlpC family hydrolase
VRGSLCLLGALGAAVALAQTGAAIPPPTPPTPGSGATVTDPIRSSIQRHLGRPYVWGSTGEKSFDCSGFVWRIMLENGVLLKRTTARKYFMSLRKTSDAQKWDFPTVVFFDDLQHMGIVNDRETFFHAQCSKGTNLSTFAPFWRSKICGFRAMPLAASPVTPQATDHAAPDPDARATTPPSAVPGTR